MNMSKKMLLIIVALTAFLGKSLACGWDSPDSDYFNLLTQEIMNDPRYRPFLMTYEYRFYPHEIMRNGNIEEWQNYLGLSYDDTRYLVFESTRDDLQKLTKGQTASDKRLTSFATPDFVKKHKQALLYLAYSKYLEPYMRIVPSNNDEGSYWDFSDDYEHNAGDLDYKKVKTVLINSWKAESDDELKLRYGYQLVRLAHYTRRYKEAVLLFDQYVKPLNLRTEMYFYALSQRAGAYRGMGETEKSNRDFIHVFANSVDLKTQAYTSMTLGWDTEINFEDFMKTAADDNERNEIYLLLGYSSFNNPVNAIEKIVANSPDAIQAKVLMVRAVNSIERNTLSQWTDAADIKNKRYPFFNDETKSFLKQALKISDKQVDKASDKNFWNLVSSYLHFLDKDFDQAAAALANVKSDDALYMEMVDNLTAYIDICCQPCLTADVECSLFARYNKMMTSNEFVGNVLVNRYALQSDHAKSFLVKNHLTEIENNLDEKLLDEIQSFLKKKSKTPLEEHLAEKGTRDIPNPNNYIAYVKGVCRLTEGNIKEAKSCFSKQTRLKVSRNLFGHNIRVWYSGDEHVVMRDDYLDDFSFIRNNMSELDVAEALLQLQKIANKSKGDEAAKANYLIANFFYNVSTTGYYRHYLRFDNNNGFCYDKFSFDAEQRYKNTLALSKSYLDKAKNTASDRELKAHLVFADAKIAQQNMESSASYWTYTMIVADSQFDEFGQYKDTQYHQTVWSNCLYYRVYHN